MIAEDQPHKIHGARVAVSSIQDGDMKSNGSKDLAQVTENIQRFATQAGFTYDRIVAMNVGAHADAWDEIVDITETPQHALVAIEDRVIADALVTTRKDVVLMLPVADCNAVAIHDPKQQVLAVVHLGWQSTAAELATKIIEHMSHHYGSKPQDLCVYSSPSIRAESYVFDHVSQANDPAWRPFLRQTEKGIGIDLPGYNRQRFIEAGVPAEQIEISSVNTATSANYFSHYRAVRSGEPDGRIALFAVL